MGRLAAGGVSGTIDKYFKEPPYKGNIIGKTGDISGVRAFSGMCKTPKGNYIFSILTSGGTPLNPNSHKRHSKSNYKQ